MEKTVKERKKNYWRFSILLLWNHSNNTWHFFWLFTDPPLPRVTFLLFLSQILKPNLPWTIKSKRKKERILSSLILLSQKNTSKCKWRPCDTLSSPICPIPLMECHVICEWPLLDRSYPVMNFHRSGIERLLGWDCNRKNVRQIYQGSQTRGPHVARQMHLCGQWTFQ